MPDEPVSNAIKRHILHLPKARMNGNGVVKRPDGEARMEKIVEELKNPQPPEQEG